MMATVSFNRPLEIKDDKAASIMIDAANDSHKAIKKINISRRLESDRVLLKKRYSH
jgi:hypothetical protein